VSCLGKDSRGDAILATLSREGVETRQVVRTGDAATGVALVAVEQEGQKQILTAPGANLRLKVEDIEAAAPSIKSARVVLCQLEVPLETLEAAIHFGHQSGATIILDPAPPKSLLNQLLRYVHVIRPNQGEAETLTGIRITDRSSARAAASELRRRGVEKVVVQVGSEGNLLVWKEGEALIPEIAVDTVDTTGAGDAFAAALAVSEAEGVAFGEAGWFATAAAALATTAVGAQAGLPRRQAVLDLIESVRFDSVPLAERSLDRHW